MKPTFHLRVCFAKVVRSSLICAFQPEQACVTAGVAIFAELEGQKHGFRIAVIWDLHHSFIFDFTSLNWHHSTTRFSFILFFNRQNLRSFHFVSTVSEVSMVGTPLNSFLNTNSVVKKFLQAQYRSRFLTHCMFARPKATAASRLLMTFM
jgi:hypothetical protein